MKNINITKVISTSFLSLLLLYLTNTYAGAPIPVQISCPASITCDYDAGVCNAPAGWRVSGSDARESFTVKTIMLSSIYGNKYTDSTGSEMRGLSCNYQYSTNPYSSISLYQDVSKLNGDGWIFSGFGKMYAQCGTPADPIACTAEK